MKDFERLAKRIAIELDWAETRVIKHLPGLVEFRFPNSTNKSELILLPDDPGYVRAFVRPIVKQNGLLDEYRRKNDWWHQGSEVTPMLHVGRADAYSRSCSLDEDGWMSEGAAIAEFLYIHGVYDLDGAGVARCTDSGVCDFETAKQL